MGKCGKCFTLFVLLVAVLVGAVLYRFPCLLKSANVPKIAEYKWWGPGNIPKGAEQAKIESRPFKVQVPDSVLQDLKRRLDSARLSAPLEGATFEYGFNTDHLKTVLDYWRTKYDWRKQEAKLNEFPQFLAKIEGIDVHYIHAKPANVDKKVKVLPLLLVHGWPGSVVEFYKIIPLLTSEASGVAFEVICPSIPGYGFSEAPHHPGFTAADAARIFTKLLVSLGHKQFYVQGGDWGSIIVQSAAIVFPERVRGLHINFAQSHFKAGYSYMPIVKYIVGHFAPSLIMEPNEKFNIFPFWKLFSNIMLESGYFHIQATKPDTLGVGLGDSPAGLAAYILEKFSTATNIKNREKKDGGLLEKFTTDELLTNVMVYWVTNTITSSVRFYRENSQKEFRDLKLHQLPVLVPSGIAVFPNEILTHPRSILIHKFPAMLTYNHMKTGGHFAALEEPKLLADDIRAFVVTCETHLKKQQTKETDDKAAKPARKTERKTTTPNPEEQVEVPPPKPSPTVTTPVPPTPAQKPAEAKVTTPRQPKQAEKPTTAQNTEPKKVESAEQKKAPTAKETKDKMSKQEQPTKESAKDKTAKSEQKVKETKDEVPKNIVTKEETKKPVVGEKDKPPKPEEQKKKESTENVPKKENVEKPVKAPKEATKPVETAKPKVVKETEKAKTPEPKPAVETKSTKNAQEGSKS